MIRAKNPELAQRVLDHLAAKYKLKEVRQGIHLSTLVYCLTKSFLGQVAPIEPTTEEVMLFALGLGLQDVLTPPDASTPIYEAAGIQYSPDFQLKILEDTCELKTTRSSLTRYDFQVGGELPDTWMEYIKGGCYILGTNEYKLVVLYMLGNYKPSFPLIDAETLTFSDDELEENWNYLLGRQAVYMRSLAENIPPQPRSYCKDWECKYCRYRTTCDAIGYYSKGES